MQRIHCREWRGRERWYVSVISSWEPGSKNDRGRGLRVQITGRSREEVKEKVDRMLRYGTLPPARYRITFRRYGEIILERERGKKIGGETGKGRQNAWKDMTELFGEMDVIQSCTQETALEMIQKLEKCELSTARKRAVWNLIMRIGADCWGNHLVLVDYFRTMKLPRLPKNQVDTLEEEEAALIMSDAKNGDQVDQALGFLITTGLRTGELQGLTMESMQEDGRKALIHRQIHESGSGDKKKFQVVEWTKTWKNRVIDVISIGAEIAKKRMKIAGEDSAAQGNADGQIIPGETLLFSLDGLPLSRNMLIARMREKLKGMPNEGTKSLGILRRTALTLYYRQMGSKIAVQQQSGDSFTVLCKYYLSVKKTELREMMEHFSSVIGRITEREGANDGMGFTFVGRILA